MNAIILGSGAVSARQEHVVTAVYVQKRRIYGGEHETVYICHVKAAAGIQGHGSRMVSL